MTFQSHFLLILKRPTHFFESFIIDKFFQTSLLFLLRIQGEIRYRLFILLQPDLFNIPQMHNQLFSCYNHVGKTRLHSTSTSRKTLKTTQTKNKTRKTSHLQLESLGEVTTTTKEENSKLTFIATRSRVFLWVALSYLQDELETGIR